MLAYIAFLLNAFNLIPIGFLDGGQVRARRSRGLARRRVIHFEGAVPVQALAPDRDARAHDRLRSTSALAGAARARDARDAAERRLVMEDRELLDQPHHELERAARHTARIADEFFAGFQAVERIDRPAVSIFGSARVARGLDAVRARARDGAKLFAEAGWAVVTGGGPGVMEAANRGCKEGGGLCVGFNIELPHEQHANPYLDISLTSTTSTRARRCS